jgi:pantoate--beta-alanine ligase
MKTVATIEKLREEVAAARTAGKQIGCVPTMGALHAGHVSLVKAAKAATDFVVVTVFVNPAQFGPSEDLAMYPRPLEEDLARCRAAGVDLVFHPDVSVVYPRENATFVEVPGLSDVLEGAFRQGHFRGVTTVVLKLLNIVLPDVAFVGRKDYQQQLLIRKMVADLDVPVEIMTCPTVREADGLALSSRNTFLSPAERETALAISRSLERARQMVENEKSSVALARSELQKRLTETAGLSLDYATIVDAATLEEDDEATCSAVDLVALVAARVGATRLIDNLPLCRSRSDH